MHFAVAPCYMRETVVPWKFRSKFKKNEHEMTRQKQMKKNTKTRQKNNENGTWRHLAAFQARLDAPLGRYIPCSKSVIAKLLKHQTSSVNQSATRKAKPTRTCSSERAPTLTTVNTIVKIKCYQCTGNVTEPKKKNHPEPIWSKTRLFQQSNLKHHLLMAYKMVDFVSRFN